MAKNSNSKKKQNKNSQKVNTKKVKEVLEEKEENFLDEDLNKEISIFGKIMNVVLWIALFAWMAICIIDFHNARLEKEPIFCLKKDVISYDDGQVKSCLGLGYKIYRYERSSLKAIEFGPFWAKERSE